MELLQVEIEIYHLKMDFKVVKYQMSQCYLSSKSKNNTRKWYFEYFIADYFPTLNKKDPVGKILDDQSESALKKVWESPNYQQTIWSINDRLQMGLSINLTDTKVYLKQTFCLFLIS